MLSFMIAISLHHLYLSIGQYLSHSTAQVTLSNYETIDTQITIHVYTAWATPDRQRENALSTSAENKKNRGFKLMSLFI